MEILEGLCPSWEALVWKKNTSTKKKIQKMLQEVQIDGHLWYVVPTEMTTSVPPKGMLKVTDVYFRNFLMLPIPELMSEVLMYGNLCFHELSLSPAFFFYF